MPIGDRSEEQRRIQLLLQGSHLSSFTQRPVREDIYNAYMNEAAGLAGWWNQALDRLETDLGLNLPDFPGSFRLGIHEPVFRSTTNSRVPYGENNGAAWYGKGINTEFMGGLYLTSEYLTVQFRPQLSWQQNTDF